MTEKGEKLVVMLTAFAVFMCGVFALSMDRGQTRTIVLACVVASMLALAIRQSVKRLKKGK